MRGDLVDALRRLAHDDGEARGEGGEVFMYVCMCVIKNNAYMYVYILYCIILYCIILCYVMLCYVVLLFFIIHSVYIYIYI